MTDAPAGATLVLEKFREFLDDDSAHLVDQPSDLPAKHVKNQRDGSKESRKHFARYLASVATHPLGLHASMAPYNCSQEQMLAYLMEAFQLSQEQLSELLLERNNTTTTTSPAKHSWVPEIKFKVGRPVTCQKGQESIDNLTVRVYLIKDLLPRGDDNPFSRAASGNEDRLVSALQGVKLDGATETVPSNQKVLKELKFTKDDSSKSSKSSKSMLPADEGRLSIKRYYAEQKSGRTLRFEFWLRNSAKELGLFQRATRCVIQKITCNRQSRTDDVDSSNDGDKFFGFVNVKLTQVPAYAIKTTYPILSLKEERVSTSEISLEFRNRLDAHEPPVPSVPLKQGNINGSKNSPEQTRIEFIVNHLRLYVSCLAFQLISLKKHAESLATNDLDRTISSVTLESLFYLPAHTLINQHRLQCNLKQLEDQSLRRSAILLLLAKLSRTKVTGVVNKSNSDFFQLLLVTVAQHEYVTAHRNFDGKTLQQMEIFDDKPASTGDCVLEVEIAALEQFFYTISRESLLKNWLSKLGQKSRDLERTLALASLRLARVMIVHVETNHFVEPKLKAKLLPLGQQVHTTITKVITDNLRDKFTILLSLDHTTGNQKEPLKARRRFRLNKLRKSSAEAWRQSPASSPPISWLAMSRDLQQIDHDLFMHWSPGGLASLDIEAPKLFSQTSGSLERLNQLVKFKMNQYLAG